MRKLSALVLAVCLFCVPVLAGDVNTPGKTPPPPPPACTENCATSATTSGSLTLLLLELALRLLRP